MTIPGPHGGDVEHIARTLGVDPASLLDLSASLNPFAPDVTELAAARLDSLTRYPDARPATALLGDTLGVDADRLLVTNGGAEAITLLAAEIGGHVVEPEFSLHPRADDTTSPLWRSNPHNPTGRLAASTDVADVWDEAFYPLATGEWSRHDHAATAVVGSLTKLFACPGLRLGYAVAAPDLIARLVTRQPEWSVNGLALALVPDLIERADLPAWAAGVAKLRLELVAVLERHGLHPELSDANYLLCRAPRIIRERLLGHGIVVRDCTSFGLPDHVRLAVPGPDGLERLDRALGQIDLDPSP
jgi:histidinol-phosphate/aromatic aminotransferase/cobyric acid decarboxylase-like protein